MTADRAGSGAPRRRIRYAGNDALAPGTREDWNRHEDNPDSPDFVPPGEPNSAGVDPIHLKPVRSERARARWWALRSKGRRRQAHGVFDG